MKKQTVNERIAEIRKEEKLNPSEFATKAGLSPGAIYKIEGGEVTPSDKTIRAICKTYGIAEDWLRYGEGVMQGEALPEYEEKENPWRDALVQKLNDENSYLRRMLELAIGGKAANFLKVVKGATLSEDSASALMTFADGESPLQVA